MAKKGSKSTLGLHWKVSDQGRINMSNGAKNKVWTEKHRENISLSLKGRIMSEEWKKKLSDSHKGKPIPLQTRIKMALAKEGKMPNNMQTPGMFMNIKRGYSDINGKKMFFRSKWESNYALYLDFLVKQGQIKSWQYEKVVFVFHKIQFGTRSYKPDFEITNNDDSIEYHEIKGWMNAQSKTKLNRMRIYYPKIKMVLIDEPVYNDIKKKLGKIIGFN